MEGFSYLPMACDEVIRAIHGYFKASNRLVLVSNNFHRSRHTDVSMIQSSQICDDDDSTDSDNID